MMRQFLRMILFFLKQVYELILGNSTIGNKFHNKRKCSRPKINYMNSWIKNVTIKLGISNNSRGEFEKFMQSYRDGIIGAYWVYF